jgi:hypothetical protein
VLVRLVGARKESRASVDGRSLVLPLVFSNGEVSCATELLLRFLERYSCRVGQGCENTPLTATGKGSTGELCPRRVDDEENI